MNNTLHLNTFNTPFFKTGFTRDFLGFEELFDRINKQQIINNGNYPPFNIIKESDTACLVEVAVAGFGSDDITVQVNEKNELEICSIQNNGEKNRDVNTLLHQGIAKRHFELRFTLDKFLKVKSADYEKGILSVRLEKEIPKDAIKKFKISNKDK